MATCDVIGTAVTSLASIAFSLRNHNVSTAYLATRQQGNETISVKSIRRLPGRTMRLAVAGVDLEMYWEPWTEGR